MKTLVMFQFEKYFTQRGEARVRKEGLSAFENFAALRETKLRQHQNPKAFVALQSL